MKKKLSIKIVWKRLFLESPTFFKRVIKIALTISGACIAAKAYLATNEINIEVVNTYLNYGITAGGIATFIAALTVQNPEDLHNTNQQ